MSGKTMPKMSMPATADQGTPSATAQMVCSTEIRKDVSTLLGTQTLPHVVTSWVNSRYTCTYHLPTGMLHITVLEAGSKPAAVAYLQNVRATYADAQTLTGVASFGLPGFRASNGAVAFAKDDKTLVVDATGMPAIVGHSNRSEFAYTVASDIIGCWNGG